MAPKEIVIDTRELPSPEPMQRVIESLDKIDDETYIKMVHRMEPKMLFNILRKNGFDFKIVYKDESQVEVYIFGNKEIREYIERLI